MPSSIGNFKPASVATILAILVAGTLLLRPLERRLYPRVASPAGARAEQLTALTGQGGMLAVLGGMRAAVAGCFWLKANLAWERHDPVATRALIELTVAADERPRYFWLNGARILAYDLPEWRPTEPLAVRQQVNEEQARLALNLLERGLRWHGADAALYVEMANIHLRRTGNVENAAHYYRLAAEQPRAPYYAARIHGELLRELGRRREALAWLRRILPRLPADDPAACRGVVLARIHALEQELGLQ